jgi:FkbM family methyltransferase
MTTVLKEIIPIYKSLHDVLKLAAKGKHPKRKQIAASYLKLQAMRRLSKALSRPIQSFRFLGYEVHFGNIDNFIYVFREIFIKESYELPAGQAPHTIIDCGSNIGMSILFFKSLYPHCKIKGIEGFPETFSLLEQNIRTNNLIGVELFNCAVGGTHTKTTFYSAPGSLVGSLNPGRGEGSGVVVDVVPLSDLINEPIDLLKIDIEGSEISVFQELEESGKLHLIKRMLVEYHHHLPSERHRLSSFLDRLERFGFDYELEASLPTRVGGFQDILIRADTYSAALSQPSSATKTASSDVQSAAFIG